MLHTIHSLLWKYLMLLFFFAGTGKTWKTYSTALMLKCDSNTLTVCGCMSYLCTKNLFYIKYLCKQMQLKAKEDKSTDLKGEGGETGGTFKQIRVSGSSDWNLPGLSSPDSVCLHITSMEQLSMTGKWYNVASVAHVLGNMTRHGMCSEYAEGLPRRLNGATSEEATPDHSLSAASAGTDVALFFSYNWTHVFLPILCSLYLLSKVHMK